MLEAVVAHAGSELETRVLRRSLEAHLGVLTEISARIGLFESAILAVQTECE